jgi:hypothetical protein
MLLAYKNFNIPELTLPFLGLLAGVQTNKPAYMAKAK